MKLKLLAPKGRQLSNCSLFCLSTPAANSSDFSVPTRYPDQGERSQKKWLSGDTGHRSPGPGLHGSDQE